MFKVKETVTNNKIPITHGAGANKYVYHSKTITSAQRTKLRPMAKERNDEMVYDVNGCFEKNETDCLLPGSSIHALCFFLLTGFAPLGSCKIAAAHIFGDSELKGICNTVWVL